MCGKSRQADPLLSNTSCWPGWVLFCLEIYSSHFHFNRAERDRQRWMGNSGLGLCGCCDNTSGCCAIVIPHQPQRLLHEPLLQRGGWAVPQSSLEALTTLWLGVLTMLRPLILVRVHTSVSFVGATRCFRMPDDKPKKTLSTTKRIAIDSATGVLAGFTLTWFITPMDQAVIEQMSGKNTIFGSLKNSMTQQVKSPVSFMASPQFKFVVGTYAGTYLSKNYIDTLCLANNSSAEATAAWKFWGVLAVNGGLSVFWKDPGMAKLFGKSTVKLPWQVYASWVARDSIHTVGAAVGPDYMADKYGWSKDQWRVAQLSFPMLTQLVTTPFHLAGLDFANVQESSALDRMKRIRAQWLPAAGIRMIRMFAPWSLGLLINRDARDWMLARAASQEEEPH